MHYSHIPGDWAAIKEQPLTVCFCGDAAIRPGSVPEERGHALLLPAPCGRFQVCLNMAVCISIRVCLHPPGRRLSGFIPGTWSEIGNILAIPGLLSSENPSSVSSLDDPSVNPDRPGLVSLRVCVPDLKLLERASLPNADI